MSAEKKRKTWFEQEAERAEERHKEILAHLWSLGICTIGLTAYPDRVNRMRKALGLPKLLPHEGKEGGDRDVRN